METGTSPNGFFPRFPVPIDYALFPFLRFLRDKGAFWSGVTRDMPCGGESKSWYEILWEDFANNPLYLGTIAKSEGITKININLAVRKDDSWIAGRFITIDMSIIEYEETLSQNHSLESITALLSTNIKDDECAFDENCAIPYQKYSKYALIKLGKCFKSFREMLSQEKFSAFLPGGVVGEHALFTIFENTIRNIKHYKEEKVLNEIKKNGIDFWISLEAKPLEIKQQERLKDKPLELFEVSVWLGYEAKLYPEVDKPEDILWKKVTDRTLQPILEESGVPRMGGNSQDKACAAMLFNNRFSTVESQDSLRDIEYFPWIHYCTCPENSITNFDHTCPK